MKTPQNRRILLVDDMPAIHEDFRKILMPQVPAGREELDAVEAALFDDDEDKVLPPITFDFDSAYQGEEGLAKLQAALAERRPYAMAFVDMRMPPGWDGLQTIEHLWRCDPRLQVVICTAYADGSWADILGRLDARDRLLILKKPFDSIEVSRRRVRKPAMAGSPDHLDVLLERSKTREIDHPGTRDHHVAGAELLQGGDSLDHVRRELTDDSFRPSERGQETDLFE